MGTLSTQKASNLNVKLLGPSIYQTTPENVHRCPPWALPWLTRLKPPGFAIKTSAAWPNGSQRFGLWSSRPL